MNGNLMNNILTVILNTVFIYKLGFIVFYSRLS